MKAISNIGAGNCFRREFYSIKALERVPPNVVRALDIQTYAVRGVVWQCLHDRIGKLCGEVSRRVAGKAGRLPLENKLAVCLITYSVNNLKPCLLKSTTILPTL